MVRVVTVQLEATERQTLESARSLAEGLQALPANANERSAQAWLDENRNAFDEFATFGKGVRAQLSEEQGHG